MRTKSILALGAMVLFGTVAVAPAQEISAPGADRVEVGLSPVGGTFFTAGPDGQGDFGNYALGANATFNANRWVGIEGELGAGLGIKQTIDYRNIAMVGLKSPNTLAYNLNVALYPRGHNVSLVPYFTVGGGGLTIFARDDTSPLDLNSNETFMSENLGGGLKWWSADKWGVRADYRFIVVNGRDNVDPFFGLNQTRYGNRVSASFMYTFGGY